MKSNHLFTETTQRVRMFVSLVVFLTISLGMNAQSDAWIDHCASNYAQMDVANKTIHITNASQLALLTKNVSEKNQDYSGWTIYLDSDINLSRYSWLPIGNYYHENKNSPRPFKGVFDGQGHKVNGIVINHTEAILGGLFGIVDGGTVKNLKVVSVTFNCSIAGGIAAHLTGGATVENCLIDEGQLNATGCNLFGCFAGIADDATISGCRIDGTLKLKRVATSGGFIGEFKKGEIKDCLMGLAGSDFKDIISGSNLNSNTKVTRCYYIRNNTSMIQKYGTERHGYEVYFAVGMVPTIEGLLAEYNLSGICAYENCLLLDSHSLYASEGSVVKFTLSVDSDNEAVIANATFDGQPMKREKRLYIVTVTKKNGYHPVEADVKRLILYGKGTASDPYQINSTYDLKNLANFVNYGGSTAGKYFLQTEDLEYNGSNNNYVPVGNEEYYPFSGTYNGEGHTISGINFSNFTSVNTGVFGTNEGTVKNLKLTNSIVSAGKNTGAIVGCNMGRVENCHVASDVTVTSEKIFPNVGGVVGYNIGTIEACTCAASVTNKSTANGYGGIVGNLGSNGKIKNCIYLGPQVQAGNSSYVGAIAGYVYKGSFENNLYCGASSADMKAIGDETQYDEEGAARGYTVTSGTEGLSLGFGSAYRIYDYNGIALYPTGMMFAGVFYTKENIDVDLTIEYDETKALLDVNASSGRISEGSMENAYILSVDQDDVAITATLDIMRTRSGISTSIQNANSDMNATSGQDAIYDLQGRKVSKNEMKSGIYIINGKKVMVK